MRVVLHLLLLLLFLFDNCGATGATNSINWEECGKTALCRVHPTCIGGDAQRKELIEPPTKVTKCHLGIHIKPQSAHKWTVSIVNEEQTGNKKTTWKLLDEIVTCTGNTPKLNEKIKVEMSNINEQSTGYTLCVFTLETANEKIYKYFNDIRDEGRSSFIIEGGNKLSFNAEYLRLKNLILCTKADLYNSLHCSDFEDCLDPENIGKDVECPEGYSSLFRLDENSNFTNAEIRCTEGKFRYKKRTDTSFQDITAGQSKAKCARKKCSLCMPREQFKELLHVQHDCHKLACSGNATIMIINTTDAKTLTTTAPVQCSDRTKVPKDKYTNYSEKDARWMVNDEDEVDIKSIECRRHPKCNYIFDSMCHDAFDRSWIQNYNRKRKYEKNND